MKKYKNSNTFNFIGCLIYFSFPTYLVVAWIINLVAFFKCDFDRPYKKEVTKAVGVFLPPAAGITVWINPSEEIEQVLP